MIQKACERCAIAKRCNGCPQQHFEWRINGVDGHTKAATKISEEMPTHTKGDMQTKEIELFVQRKQKHQIIQNAVQEYFETKKRIQWRGPKINITKHIVQSMLKQKTTNHKRPRSMNRFNTCIAMPCGECSGYCRWHVGL